MLSRPRSQLINTPGSPARLAYPPFHVKFLKRVTYGYYALYPDLALSLLDLNFIVQLSVADSVFTLYKGGKYLKDN
jgi:hypothetical protein